MNVRNTTRRVVERRSIERDEPVDRLLKPMIRSCTMVVADAMVDKVLVDVAEHPVTRADRLLADLPVGKDPDGSLRRDRNRVMTVDLDLLSLDTRACATDWPGIPEPDHTAGRDLLRMKVLEVIVRRSTGQRVTCLDDGRKVVPNHRPDCRVDYAEADLDTGVPSTFSARDQQDAGHRIRVRSHCLVHRRRIALDPVACRTDEIDRREMSLDHSRQDRAEDARRDEPLDAPTLMERAAWARRHPREPMNHSEVHRSHCQYL